MTNLNSVYYHRLSAGRVLESIVYLWGFIDGQT